MSDVHGIPEATPGKGPMVSALDKIEAHLTAMDGPPPKQQTGKPQATKATATAKPPTRNASPAKAPVEEEPLDDPRLAETEEETAAAAGEAPEGEAAADEDAESEEAKAEGKEESETGSVDMPETVEDFAKAVGIEPDDLLGLKDKDGKTLAEKLTGGDAEEARRLRAAYDGQSAALKTEQESFTQAVKEYSERYKGAVQYLAELIKAGETFIAADGYTDEQLDRLFETDNLAYQRVREGRSRRKEYLDQIKSGYQQARHAELRDAEQQTEKQKADREDQRRERVKRGTEALAKEVPELAPGHPKRAETSSAIIQYAASIGFKPEDVTRAADNGDHRIIVVLNHARLYRQGQESKGQVVKKIRALNLPKLTPPNGRAPKADARVEQFRKHKAQLRRTGSQRDAEHAFAALIGE